jgi:DNA-binding CsgD family transcriptional regulator
MRGSRALQASGETSVADMFGQAPFEVGGWDRALKRLADGTRSSHMQLIAVGGPGLIPFNHTTEAEDGFVDQFVEIGGGDPLRNWRIAVSGGLLEVVSEAHYADARKGRRFDIYNDYVSRFDVPFGCQAVLATEQGLFMGLAALRSQADGPTGEADRRLFEQAAPHALAAIRLQRSIEHRGAALVSGALESLGTIGFVLDATGGVGSITGAAEHWMMRDGRLNLVDGRLWARNGEDHRLLQRALATMLSPSPPSLPERFWLRGGGEAPVPCELFALPSREWNFGFGPRAMLVVRLPEAPDTALAAALRELFGLTAAEADIALRLVRGQSRAQIAFARGATINTVKAQIKTIFGKLGVTREVELVVKANALIS